LLHEKFSIQDPRCALHKESNILKKIRTHKENMEEEGQWANIRPSCKRW